MHLPDVTPLIKMTNLSNALNSRGLIFLAKQRHDAAEQFFREAMTVDPTSADAWTNLGVTLFMSFKFPEAVAAFTASIDLRPDHPDTLLNYGYSLWRTGKPLDARAAFERAIDLSDRPQAHSALGALCWELADDEGAIRHARLALQHNPSSHQAHDTLYEVYRQQGNKMAALMEIDALCALAPQEPLHPYKRAIILLAHNDPQGWEAYECRLTSSLDNLSEAGRSDPYWFSKLYGTRWTGQATRHLLIHREQGYGDVIQFLRFLPLVAQRCAQVSVFLPPALNRIARASFDHINNLEFCEQVPHQFDHYCHVMSLPYLLDSGNDIPNLPYLRAPHGYDSLRRHDGLKIGLAWAGSSGHVDDRWRSIPFEVVARLLSLPFHFIKLQMTDDVLHPSLIPLPYETTDGFLDWADTAALLDALDLVITADTAIAHMAGALGKPVWLMNRVNSDWRWGLKGSGTRWYPSMRIFRQTKLGQWETVIETIAEALLTRFA